MPSKYGNRRRAVCRACGAIAPSVAATGMLGGAERWEKRLRSGTAVPEPERCPSCGEAWHGFVADSTAEARRYGQLLLRQRSGEITDLAVHPRYTLAPAFRDGDGHVQRGIEYEADYSYLEDGREVVEDVKGVETQTWRLKRALFLRVHRDCVLRVIRAEDVG